MPYNNEPDREPAPLHRHDPETLAAHSITLLTQLRTDLLDSRQEFRTGMIDMKQDVRTSMSDLREDIRESNSELHTRMNGLDRKFWGIIITVISSCLGLIGYLLVHVFERIV